jgi:hypothetical protein
MGYAIDYYEVDILCRGLDPGDDKFHEFDRITKLFDTIDEAVAWIKDKYNFKGVTRKIMYHGDMEPCGYVYRYKNGDVSHVPVEEWCQEDWVSVSKVHSELMFKEIEYEI